MNKIWINSAFWPKLAAKFSHNPFRLIKIQIIMKTKDLKSFVFIEIHKSREGVRLLLSANATKHSHPEEPLSATKDLILGRYPPKDAHPEELKSTTRDLLFSSIR